MGGAVVELSLPQALPPSLGKELELSGPGSFLKTGLRMMAENAGPFQVPASFIIKIIVFTLLYRKPLLTTPEGMALPLRGHLEVSYMTA